MKKPVLYKFRVRTGRWDERGELFMFWIGGRVIPDGPHYVWLTNPKGEKILQVKRSDLEPVDNHEVTRYMMREMDLAKKETKSPLN